MAKARPKQCTGCGEEKPLSDFPKDKRSPDGHLPRCKECKNEYQRQWHEKNPGNRKESQKRYDGSSKARESRRREKLKKRYGISAELYDEWWESQNGLCAICGNPEPTKTKKLAVDHDHDTGRIRGLLCSYCNQAIGLLRDNPSTIEKAAAYIRSAGQLHPDALVEVKFRDHAEGGEEYECTVYGKVIHSTATAVTIRNWETPTSDSDYNQHEFTLLKAAIVEIRTLTPRK